MTPYSLTVRRILSCAHIVAAIVLLPTTMFLGCISTFIVTPALLWLVILGIRLWNPNTRLRKVMRYTHLLLCPIAILLLFYGTYALRAAQRSAEAGGGLLGALGLIPIVMGLTAGCLAFISLWVSYFTTFE